VQERAVQIVFLICAAVSAVVVLSMVYSLLSEGFPIISDWFLNGFGINWAPSNGNYGVITLVFLTFYAGIGCTAVATIVGIPTAIYLAEFADRRLRNIVKPCLEVLTGIPSVIIGLVGIAVVVSAITATTGPGTGPGILAVWIVVGIMSLPTVATISEDAIKAVPKELKEASLGLGATRWQTMTKVLVPVAMPGILAAVLLGMGNAIGETMAASFIVGNVDPKLTLDLIHHSNLIPPIIAQGAIGDFVYSPPLYAIGFILFVIIGILNLIIRRLVKGRASGAPRGIPPQGS
jgi:phosphate transport system permease protein